jgi:hypothetical protein
MGERAHAEKDSHHEVRSCKVGAPGFRCAAAVYPKGTQVNAEVVVTGTPSCSYGWEKKLLEYVMPTRPCSVSVL